MMKNFRKLILTCCFLIYVVTRAERKSVKIKCSVNYLGIIYFIVSLPEGSERWSPTALYYKPQRSQDRWIPETDCQYLNNKKDYSCAMPILTKKDRSLLERIHGYKFKFSLKLNKTVVNTTDMVFKDYPNVTINPWKTINQLTYCTGGYGVKHIALNASYDNIGIEWIRYPLEDSINFDSIIRIRGPGIDKEDDVDKSISCQEDVCNFKYPSLKPCVEYEICLKTFNNIKTAYHEKCRNVRTYCDGMNKATVKWKDTLLCVFGVIIMIFIIMIFILSNKPALFSRVFIDIDTQGEIVDQEDLVNPAPPSMNGNMTEGLNASSQHVYLYPYAVTSCSEDLNQF